MEIITIKINGRERRFVKDKLQEYLKHNKLPDCPNIKIPKTQAPKKKQVSKYKRVEKRKVRTDYTRKGLAVIIKYPDGSCKECISLTSAAKDTALSKGWLSKIINGKKENNTGFEFQLKTA